MRICFWRKIAKVAKTTSTVCPLAGWGLLPDCLWCSLQVLRWLNTVLQAVSGNSRDGACFKSDKQTWRRKKQWYTNSSGVCQFWKKRKQWSTSPTITWSPWRWSFFKTYQMVDKGEDSIDQNSRLFLFYRAFYLSSRYYELGSTLRTGSNHSRAIVLRLSRA